MRRRYKDLSLYFLLIAILFIAHTHTYAEISTPSLNGAQQGSEEKKDTTKKQTEEEKRKERIAQAEIKKVEWIEKTMKYGINKERKDAISFIPTVADAAKKDALAAKMTEIMKTENDAGVMVRSIETAAEIKYAPAIPVIITALDHKSEDVRISAIYGLKTLDAKTAAGTIFERLQAADLSVDSNFTNGLIETLGAFAHAPLAPLAQEKITDFKTTKNHRLSLLIALGKIKDPASVEFLMKLFKDPNEDIDVRSYAVNAIANIGHKASGPEIDAIMKEIDTYPFEKRKKFYSLYMYCVTSLVRLGDVSSYPRLEDSLKSDNTAVRIQAIRLMKELKDKRSVDILKYKAEYDPAPKVQSEAFDALKEFGIDYKKELEDKKKGSTPATK